MAEITQKPLWDYWSNRWETGNTPWNRPDIHPLLTAHENEVLANKRDAQVFIPLCGKAKEVKWFYDRGHRVAGLEYVEKTARQFFEENKLPYEEATCPVINCKILQTVDKRLRIFVCSVFDLKKESVGPVDIIWDRGALVAVNKEDRSRYISVMRPLMSPDCTYILISVVHDDDSYTGFPTSIPDDTVRELFGKEMKITKMAENRRKKDHFYIKAPISEVLWCITF
ncbi:probable thiopurine S-methyltransferase [Ixodes scapularis]|uniref:probable thiopurine S-methyltransferase n=1 Tax=Ixodes scapularis TaxID=6945 RepID=UPI001A9CF79F|nr:probable thiopurine S-methyltransferase [Ixodes scapularis]